MPPKKETFIKIEDDDQFEPYLDDNYPKLVIVDLYFPWAGPCEAMKEHYKTFHTNINGFGDRCEIIQLKNSRIKFFESYGTLKRANVQTELHIYIQGQNRC